MFAEGSDKARCSQARELPDGFEQGRKSRRIVVDRGGFLQGVTLVLGGARSGKSAFAEDLVLKSGLAPVYVATSQVWDDEMRVRVDAHAARRGEQWTCIEEPDGLERALGTVDMPENAVLVDCMTLWITNLMMGDADIAQRSANLIDRLENMTAPVVLVSNEVGLGIVPENKMAREFRDHAGALHQGIAAIANTVYFIAAGLPLRMKG